MGRECNKTLLLQNYHMMLPLGLGVPRLSGGAGDSRRSAPLPRLSGLRLGPLQLQASTCDTCQHDARGQHRGKNSLGMLYIETSEIRDLG